MRPTARVPRACWRKARLPEGDGFATAFPAEPKRTGLGYLRTWRGRPAVVRRAAMQPRESFLLPCNEERRIRRAAGFPDDLQCGPEGWGRDGASATRDPQPRLAPEEEQESMEGSGRA